MTTTMGRVNEITYEPWRMGAFELAGAIGSGLLSSREAVQSHLDRIEAVNPVVNAVTVILAEAALQAASAADDTYRTGVDRPSLHGVPFTVKENIDLMGAATTQGLRALAGSYPSRDAPVVERLKRAGAIPIGHTNCPTIAVRWHTDSELWGPTLNPWDLQRTPGASSGGDAVAVATGMTPIGLGNDGLGSLRWPAQCCGVAALKPTLGRVPHASSIEPVDAAIGVQLTSVEGPIARRVVDLRGILQVLSGPTWRDPWTIPARFERREPSNSLAVAVVTNPPGGGIAPQVEQGVRKAADILADRGYAIEEVAPPFIEEAARLLLDMLNTPDVRALLQTTSSILPADTRRFLSAFYGVAGDVDPVTIMQNLAARTALSRAWAEFQETYPLVLAPIGTGIPFVVGTDLDDGMVEQTIRDMRMAMTANSLGLPAVAVPVGLADDLPQVVQLIGGRFREDLCLDAAEVIEERSGILTPIDPMW